jgi:hypothetical protein
VVGERETLRLAFRVRQGWCVDGENTPPPSCISSEGRGSSGVLTGETPPPSRISSEGGVVVGERKTLCLVFQVRKGVGCVDGGNNPSVSHFE